MQRSLKLGLFNSSCVYEWLRNTVNKASSVYFLLKEIRNIWCFSISTERLQNHKQNSQEIHLALQETCLISFRSLIKTDSFIKSLSFEWNSPIREFSVNLLFKSWFWRMWWNHRKINFWVYVQLCVWLRKRLFWWAVPYSEVRVSGVLRELYFVLALRLCSQFEIN